MVPPPVHSDKQKEELLLSHNSALRSFRSGRKDLHDSTGGYISILSGSHVAVGVLWKLNQLSDDLDFVQARPGCAWGIGKRAQGKQCEEGEIPETSYDMGVFKISNTWKIKKKRILKTRYVHPLARPRESGRWAHRHKACMQIRSLWGLFSEELRT